jgi:hypothetical protein
MSGVGQQGHGIRAEAVNRFRQHKGQVQADADGESFRSRWGAISVAAVHAVSKRQTHPWASLR